MGILGNLGSIAFPSIQVSLQAWRFLQKFENKDTHDIEYKFPIDLLQAKFPMLSTMTHCTQGKKYIQDLTTGPTPKSAEQIMTEYQLPKKLFSCMRISHFLYPSTPYTQAENTN